MVVNVLNSDLTNLIDKSVETVGVCDTEVEAGFEAGSETAEKLELEIDSISVVFPFSCSFSFMITRWSLGINKPLSGDFFDDFVWPNDVKQMVLPANAK